MFKIYILIIARITTAICIPAVICLSIANIFMNESLPEKTFMIFGGILSSIFFYGLCIVFGNEANREKNQIGNKIPDNLENYIKINKSPSQIITRNGDVPNDLQ